MNRHSKEVNLFAFFLMFFVFSAIALSSLPGCDFTGIDLDNDNNNDNSTVPTPTPTPTPIPACFPDTAPCSINTDCCSLSCVALLCASVPTPTPVR